MSRCRHRRDGRDHHLDNANFTFQFSADGLSYMLFSWKKLNRFYSALESLQCTYRLQVYLHSDEFFSTTSSHLADLITAVGDHFVAGRTNNQLIRQTVLSLVITEKSQLSTLDRCM